MSIRRVLYQIDYYHVLTFKDQYKQVVNEYFALDDVSYSIENENTLQETFRLFLKALRILIVLKKESIILVYEGDVDELRNPNGPMKFFWDLYEKIKTFNGYTKNTRHVLLLHAVKLLPDIRIDLFLTGNSLFNYNPFGKLDEVACIYEFKKDSISYNFQFGNFNKKDIKKEDLMPFNSEFNEDLKDNVGLMGRLELQESEPNPTFSKFKSFLSKGEKTFENFKLFSDEQPDFNK